VVCARLCLNTGWQELGSGKTRICHPLFSGVFAKARQKKGPNVFMQAVFALVNFLFLQASHALVSLTCRELIMPKMVSDGVPCKGTTRKPNACCRHTSCGGDEFRKFVVRYPWQKARMLMCDAWAGQAAGIQVALGTQCRDWVPTEACCSMHVSASECRVHVVWWLVCILHLHGKVIFIMYC